MSTAWDGTISQAELMLKDECILVDEKDAIVGHDSKYNSHRFVASQPHGLLHRAFSVFLFDGAGRLLLQQRAASKVTFPRVWTNTCCSHQLYGYSPSEVDSDKDIATGRVPGAKAAAVRKLHQELGIARGRVSAQDFTFLTRLHYCALDSVAARLALQARGARLPSGASMRWITSCWPRPTSTWRPTRTKSWRHST